LNIENKHIVFFIGIGGIGMSALARWFKLQGKYVSGYDRTETTLTRKLIEEGIHVFYDDSAESIPEKVRKEVEDTLVIFTPAIPADNHILNYLRNENYSIHKRSEILGLITGQNFTVAVAGTHGKTTTCSIIAHIAKEADLNSIAFLGGITQNYSSNLIFNKKEEESLIVIVEADEYDRSFLTLNPDIAVITAVDSDHLDIYGSKEDMEAGYTEFILKIKPNGLLIIKKGLLESIFPEGRTDIRIIEYNLDHNPVRSENIRIEKEEMRFCYKSPDTDIENIPLSIPGFYNIENSIAAITVGLQLGIEGPLIKSALSSFRGIKRRFEYILYTDDLVFIDDYAHHPEEIKALLSSLRAIFENRKITAVFQPHLFTRTRDFAEEFAHCLDIADEVILLDIYPAREKPIPGISPKIILEKMTIENRKQTTNIELIELLSSNDLDVLVTIGAGDIDKLINPIKIMLETKYEISKN